MKSYAECSAAATAAHAALTASEAEMRRLREVYYEAVDNATAALKREYPIDVLREVAEGQRTSLAYMNRTV